MAKKKAPKDELVKMLELEEIFDESEKNSVDLKAKTIAKYMSRPPIFETPEDMQYAVEEYFKELTDDKGRWIRPPTIAGLAFALGMSSRSVLNYEKRAGYEGFFPIVKRAKLIIELFLEERGAVDNNRNVMSLLSMNFGRTEVKKVEFEDKTDFAAQLNAAKSRLKPDANKPK